MYSIISSGVLASEEREPCAWAYHYLILEVTHARTGYKSSLAARVLGNVGELMEH